MHINFYDDGGAGAYTPVGNTFYNFDLGVDASNPAIPFTAQTDAALVDSSNAATGYTFDFSVSADGFSNGGATSGEFDTAKPSTGFDWYDTSAASLRETGIAGTPPRMESGGMLLLTTAPAAMTELRPMGTPSRMRTPQPIQTKSSM